MGRNKMLFELDGESILRRAARRALAGGLSPLAVVLGHEAERARAELAGLDCGAVVNPGFEEGITSSVRAGIEALPGDVAALAILLADMPYVTSEMISGLVERFRAGEAPLVVSCYDGIDAPPMVYDRSLFGELLEMSDGRCGKQVVKRHRHEAEIVERPAEALADLDVPEDYERVLARAAHRASETEAPGGGVPCPPRGREGDRGDGG
jgi:molybdenum cofactor cytidylyltransferase